MKSLLLLSLLTFSCLSWSQLNDWTLFKSVDGIEFYSKLTDCTDNRLPDQRAMIIKAVNTNNVDATIEWDLAIWYNDVLITDANSAENHQLIFLQKNETAEGTCDTPRGPYYIMKEWIDLSNTRRLTNFEFQNIKVIK